MIHNYRMQDVKVDFLLWHCSYILADMQYAHGRALPAHDHDRKIVYLKDEPTSKKVTSTPETLRKTAGLAVPARVRHRGEHRSADAIGDVAAIEDHLGRQL